MDESWIFHLHRVSKKQNKLTPEASAITVIYISQRMFRDGFEILLIRFQISPNYFRSPIIVIQHWTKRKLTVFNVPKRKQFEWRHNTRHCRPYKVSTPQQCVFPTVVRRTPFKPHERKDSFTVRPQISKHKDHKQEIKNTMLNNQPLLP